MSMRVQAPGLAVERALSSSGRRIVAGIDEVGRGSWAGPVVAAAVVLPLDAGILVELRDVRDSKCLLERERERLLGPIMQSSIAIGLGWSSHHVIDRVGIAGANRLAMARAIMNLSVTPQVLLIDAVRLPDVPLPQVCLPKGETWSTSIAAASIVAKVVRDRWIVNAGMRFPGYGFERNKGYGTPEHRSALLQYGPCPLHRRSFRPLAQFSA